MLKRLSNPDKKLKILFVNAEAAPYASVGGFSRVVDALSKQLISLGHDVRIFMPKFGFIDETTYPTTTILSQIEVPTDDTHTPNLVCNVKLHTPETGPKTYFLENMEYYEKRANVYGYTDDATRWALLTKGALEFILQSDEFLPDVIHLHDWHTAVLANYLNKNYAEEEKLKSIATLFTIHNLQFQGNFDHKNVSELDSDDGKSRVASFFDQRLITQNFMKRGILYSDAINAVSPTYSREILTPEYGEGLDMLLLELRSKLFGVLNGIDYEAFDPETDNYIAKNFSVKSIENRLENKYALQKEFGLPVSEKIPLFGFVGRLTHQKGVDLILQGMRYLIKDFNVQFILVGGGDGYIIEQFNWLKKDFPKNVGIHPMPNFTLPRLVFAGSDMILYPSLFEPCGIVQMEAMRYGAIPIVRKVGGLADSVVNYDPETGEGDGFVFEDYNAISFYGQMVRAVETFRHQDAWKKIQTTAMKKDFSWVKSAEEYVKLYKKAINFHNTPDEGPKTHADYMLML